MKTIRTSTFETNSSSSHSLTISRANNSAKLNFKGKDVTFSGGEYGWGYDDLTTPFEKMEYIAQEIIITNNTKLKEWFESILEDCNCGEIIYNNADGYIDHQSCGTVNRDVSSKEELFDLIFGSGRIIIDNDNH